jgi:hypothetical protein
MLYGAEVAVCSEIYTKQINSVWAERTIFSVKPFGARNQYALTFKNCASYIKTGVTLPSKCCILYIFSTNISTEYFKNAAHSPFFSSKYRLFHNATLFWFLYYSHFTYRVC